MKIYIKFMVCVRCKMVVEEQLKKLSIRNAVVKLGEVELTEILTDTQLTDFRAGLLKFGLVVLDDKKSLLVAKIKKVIIELIHDQEEALHVNFSNYLSQKLNYKYTYMANIFSELEGVNVEQYLITLKVERVKELLINHELSLINISYKLNYSSVAHLCNQFKKITGITPSNFRKSVVSN
ncbi:MAG: helix-turn-helix domain-containing protein [Sphingobacteriaceae bacterium]